MTSTQEPFTDDRLSGTAAEDVVTVAKGGATQIVGQISQRSLSFLFTLVATRILNFGGFGLYSQVVKVLAIGGQLGLAGFNYASMRFIARSRAQNDAGGVRSAARIGLVGAGIGSAAVVAALALGADRIAAAFEHDPETRSELAYLLRIGAAYIPLFAAMQVLRYCTQAYKTMVPSVIVGNIVQPSVRFLIGVPVLLAGFAVTGAVLTLVVSVGVGAIAAAYYFRRLLTPAEEQRLKRGMAGEMVRFALPQGGASLLSPQALGLGVIAVGLFSSRYQVGLFTVGLALQGPGGVFLSGIVNIWAPVVSDLHDRGDIERLGSLYKTLTRWVATFSFPIFGALIVQPELFAAIFGNADLVPVIAILAAGNLLYTGTGPSGYVLSMTGRPGVNFANSIVAVVLYFAGAALVVPDYGAVGMAIVDSCVIALINSARVVEGKLLVGVQPYGRSFLKPVVATLVAAAFLLVWKLALTGGLLLQIPGVALAAVVYIGVLYLFGLDPEERYVWERIRSRAFRRTRAERRSRTTR